MNEYLEVHEPRHVCPVFLRGLLYILFKAPLRCVIIAILVKVKGIVSVPLIALVLVIVIVP